MALNDAIPSSWGGSVSEWQMVLHHNLLPKVRDPVAEPSLPDRQSLHSQGCNFKVAKLQNYYKSRYIQRESGQLVFLLMSDIFKSCLKPLAKSMRNRKSYFLSFETTL